MLYSTKGLAVGLAAVTSIIGADNAFAQNWTGPIWDFQSRTCHDSGTCDNGMNGGGERFQVCKAVAPDLLAERILYALGALNMCYGYTETNYQAFLRDVPPAQHYAVNYLHYGFGQPLLSAQEAQVLEAQDFPRMAQLPGAPAVPGGTRYVAPATAGDGNRSNRQRVVVNRPGGETCPEGTSSSVRWGGTDWNLNDCRSPSIDRESVSVGTTGACGFPLSLANAASQDGMAGVEGGCAWLAESVGAEASEGAGTPAAVPVRPAQLADGGKLGDCGIPYPNEEARLDQVFFAEEGECDEYVAEIEAEGY